MRVVHIDLREWADILLIAPLTANTLAKMANGFCDNLLTCIVRAWNTKKPMMIAPAMNTKMWENKFTAKHLEAIKDTYGVRIIEPVIKRLACDEVGIGAMEEIGKIVEQVNGMII
jgi:phosphopantothenoylcysteine decarboxylase